MRHCKVHSGGTARARIAGAVAALALAACATPAPEPEPPPAPAAPPPVIVAPPPACPSCDEQAREIARLQQELTARDAELRELRSTQREQARSAQETTKEVTREVTRAKAKARRLATQADAASYLAEVEVAIAALRNAAPSGLPALASAYLAAASEPFARGDYGTAMERASQAEQIVALATGTAPTLPKSARAPGERLLEVALPMRATGETRVRRQPQGKAAQVGVIAKDATLTAFAWKDGWLRVETEDGLAGWVEQSQLAVR